MKLRLSFSLMSLWEKGDTQGAIDCYFHLDRKGTKQMEDGKRFHQEIADNIKRINSLPNYMDFKTNFISPKPEHEVVVSYNELFDLKGVLDCLDEPILYEFKTGVASSLEWTRTLQIPLYFLICELAGIKVDTAYLIHYNQYRETTDFSVVHNGTGVREKARNFVDTVAPDIYYYFKEQGLL